MKPRSASVKYTVALTVNNITFGTNTIGRGLAVTNTGTNLTFAAANLDTVRVAGTITMITNTLFTVNSNGTIYVLRLPETAIFRQRLVAADVNRIPVLPKDTLRNGVEDHPEHLARVE